MSCIWAPSPRRPARLLVTLLALGAGLLAACGGPAAPAQPPANQGLVLNRPTPQQVGLTNQEGQAVSLASLRGKVVVLAPFLSLCQDECPLVTGAFIALQRDVRAAGMGQQGGVPRDDGRPRARHRGPPGGLPKGVRGRLGSVDGHQAAIAAFWKPFGVSYQIVPEEQPPKTDWYTGQPLTYDVDHTDGYILIDADGRERFVDVSAPNMAGKLDQKLTSLLNAGGVYDLHHPQQPSWTVADALTSISWLLGTTINPAS